MFVERDMRVLECVARNGIMVIGSAISNWPLAQIVIPLGLCALDMSDVFGYAIS